MVKVKGFGCFRVLVTIVFLVALWVVVYSMHTLDRFLLASFF